MPKRRFHTGRRKAMLCEISCIASVIEWLMVPPSAYAQMNQVHHERCGTTWTHMAIWMDTGSSTCHLSHGHGPTSSSTSGCFSRMALRRAACGSCSADHSNLPAMPDGLGGAALFDEDTIA